MPADFCQRLWRSRPPPQGAWCARQVIVGRQASEGIREMRGRAWWGMCAVFPCSPLRVGRGPGRTVAALDERVLMELRRHSTCCAARLGHPFNRSVPRGSCGPQPSLRTHLLRREGCTFTLRVGAAVEQGEDPDACKADGHGEQRWGCVGEQGASLGVAQNGFPHRG